MRSLRSALLALVVAIVACALGAAPALADTVVIDAVDSPAPAFQPPNVTIDAGDTVRLEFDAGDDDAHGHVHPAPTGRSTRRRDPNGAPISQDLRHRRHLHVPVQRPHRHDRVGHGPGAPRQHARQGARLLQDRGLPARLDPAGHRGDPGARHGQRLHGRRDRGRGRSSPTPTSRSTTSSSSSPRPATSSTTPSRRRSSTTSRPAAATSASTPRPTPSTRGPGTARCSAATSATTRPARRPRRSRSRTPTSPPRPAFRTPGARVGRVVQLPAADQPRRQRRRQRLLARATAASTSSPTVDESTYDEDDGNTADDDHPVAWCTDFDGGRAWYTGAGPHAGLVLRAGLPRPHPRRPQDRRAAPSPPTAARRARPPAGRERLRDPHARRRHREPDGARRRQGRPRLLRRAHHRRGQRHQGRTARSLTAGAIPVSSVQENGLLGIALDPNFDDQPQLLRRVHAAAGLLDGDPHRALHAQRRHARPGVRAGHLPDAATSARSAATRPARWPSGLDGSLYMSTRRQHQPVRLGRLQPDRRARRAAASGTPSARRPTRNSYSGKILRIIPLANPTGPGRRHGLHDPHGQPLPRGRGHARTRPCPRSSRWASAIRSGSRSTRSPARC